MGLSSSKSTQTSNQQSTAAVAPNPTYAPQIDAAAASLKPAYDTSLATAQSYLPQLQQASGYYGDVLSGKHLHDGPAFQESQYLQPTIDATNHDITDQVNGQFMSRFGSGYHAKALANALAANENQLRYGDAVRRDGLQQQQYMTERGYQNGAGQNIAATAAAATALPLMPAESYANSINGLLGKYVNTNSTGSGTAVTKSSPSLMSSIGQAAQIASLFV